jgi:hypothetical protein
MLTRRLVRGERTAMANMIPKQILGIPIIEEAAPSGFAAQQDRELHSQLKASIDRLRCPSCGSLDYETTLFVFRAVVEKMIECRNCGDVHQAMLFNDVGGLLGFLPSLICSSLDFSE